MTYQELQQKINACRNSGRHPMAIENDIIQLKWIYMNQVNKDQEVR